MIRDKPLINFHCNLGLSQILDWINLVQYWWCWPLRGSFYTFLTELAQSVPRAITAVPRAAVGWRRHTADTTSRHSSALVRTGQSHARAWRRRQCRSCTSGTSGGGGSTSRHRAARATTAVARRRGASVANRSRLLDCSRPSFGLLQLFCPKTTSSFPSPSAIAAARRTT